MIINFNDTEIGEMLKLGNNNDLASGSIATRLKNYYEANFSDDLQKVVEMFKEDRNNTEDEAFDFRGAKAEAIKRLLKDEENHPFVDSLTWLDKCLIVTTRRAFELAYKDKTVIQLYADGTDSELDAMDIEEEYFPDKSQSWPNVETIFLVEKP